MSSSRVLAIAAAAAVVALVPAGGASANPAGKSTLQETIGKGSGAFKRLVRGPGEAYVVRTSGLGTASATRAARRASLAFFAQITDPQIADEMSPARVDFVDPAGGDVSASWRPQEAFDSHVFDLTVRNINRNRTSPVRQGSGTRRRLGFAVTTGDLPDNQQFNETRWFIDILNGGRELDPFSGKKITASNPCSGATPSEIATLNANVTGRKYTGIQNYANYAAANRYGGFWDPNLAPPPTPTSLYRSFPRYPGILDRAQRPFTPEGLKVPWYTSRGNHDGLIQGNAPASEALFRAIVTGCLKVFPSAAFNPDQFKGKTATQLFKELGDPAFVAKLLGGAGQTPPDPDRRFVSKPEYKKLHGTADRGHGFALVDPAQNRASRGTASYYAWSPSPKFRFIAMDSVAEGGGANGNLDDPQYRWLESELDRNSSVKYTASGKLVHDTDPNRLIVVYGHHTLDTMDNPRPDEDAGCTNPNQAGCDGDPRNSRPIHLGTTGANNLRELLWRYPNVVTLVVGHTHHNAVDPVRKPGTSRGFWQVNTASHVDWPQQSRLIEILDNRDGNLSIFGTILDTAAPVAAPPSGTRTFTDTQLGSVSRLLAANDPQSEDVTSGPGLGRRVDRNVELLIRDPRRLVKPGSGTLPRTTARR